MRWTLIVPLAGLLLGGCASVPDARTSLPVVAETNKRFWFRDLRAVPRAEGLVVSGRVIRKKGGFLPIPGYLHVEAMASGTTVGTADTRWQRLRWKSRSVSPFKTILPGGAGTADQVRISYRADDPRQPH
jgi:hypothetical protein